MLFYRVENEKHEGPYNNSYVSLMEYLEKRGHDIWLTEHDDYMRGHPRPDSDYLLASVWAEMGEDTHKKYIFGFENIELLFNWFCMSEEIDFMKEFGFYVSVYETDDCYNGKWQSIANKDSLRLIEKMQF
jgi:hypothetical protein